MATLMNKQETLLLVTLALSFLTVCACERLDTDSGNQESVESLPDPVDAVDLGVVYTRSDGTTYKLLWATRNLCKTGFVTSRELFGDYYGWGELAPQDVYDWKYYRWSDGDDHKLTRYCPEDKAGFVGHYWTASLFTGHPYSAWSIAFTENYVTWLSTARYEGFQIRPVKEEVVRNRGNGR